MKKKNKPKAPAGAPEFSFKEFTPEESRIYDEAVQQFRKAVDEGKTLSQAYDSFAIADPELRSIIQADFLKILIAERHFGMRQPLDKIAETLGVSKDLIAQTHARMLQEVGSTAAAQAQPADVSPKTND